MSSSYAGQQAPERLFTEDGSLAYGAFDDVARDEDRTLLTLEEVRDLEDVAPATSEDGAITRTTDTNPAQAGVGTDGAATLTPVELAAEAQVEGGSGRTAASRKRTADAQADS